MGSEWAQTGPRMVVEWERHWMAEATRRRRKLVETALNGQGRVLFILNILTDAMKVVWTCKYCIWRACFPHIAPCYEQALPTLLAFKVVFQAFSPGAHHFPNYKCTRKYSSKILLLFTVKYIYKLTTFTVVLTFCIFYRYLNLILISVICMGYYGHVM